MAKRHYHEVRENRAPARLRGFTLLESLVAMVVLSVGMLGVGALYIESLQAGRDAVIRSKAVNLAADMADRIRSNRQGRAAYGGASANNNCADTAATATVICTPAQMAAHDLFLWNQILNDSSIGIPDANGTVVFDGTTAPATYTITVSWTLPGEPLTQLYRVVVQT